MANWICPQCSMSNISDRRTCKGCGSPFNPVPPANSASFKPINSSGTQTTYLPTNSSPSASLASEEYKMVQIPRTFRVSHENEAAHFLQNLANQYAEVGWQFFRIDEIGVISSPGCIAALFGAREVVIPYYIVTFKRSR